MSLRYRSSDGTEQIIAGLTPGGDIEAGAVAQRSGTVSSGTVASGATESVNVTFDSPMPDDDYIVNFNTPDTGRLNLRVTNKTANGFTVSCMNNTSSSASSDIEYTAFKTYTVQHDVQNSEAIANIQAAMPADAGSANKLATKSYVDNADSAIDSRLDNIEDAMPATASITNKLATKNDVDNVQIDALGDIADVEVTGVQSGQTILWDSDDSKWVAGQAGKVYTAGDGIEISTLDKISVDDEYVPLTFVGTKAQWDELTVSQKAKYTLVNITDDPATGGAVVVDRVAEGNMNPVTSNAVATNMVNTVKNGETKPVSSDAVWDFLFKYFQPVVSEVATNATIDLDNVTTGGFANFLVSPTNPHSCGSYGYLLVLRYGNSASPNVVQVSFPYHSGDILAIRCRFAGSWTSWKNYGSI